MIKIKKFHYNKQITYKKAFCILLRERLSQHNIYCLIAIFLFLGIASVPIHFFPHRNSAQVNAIDIDVIAVLGGFSRSHLEFSRIVEVISSNNLFKGGVLIPIVCWAWFKSSGSRPQDEVRLRLMAMYLSCAFSMFFARLLAKTLPFRVRPVFSKNLSGYFPEEIVRVPLDNWSSFPSDHAALFFALATGLVCVSRPAGIAALIYTLLFIGFPRVFLGLHFLTDVAAGAAIGMIVATIGNVLFEKSDRLRRVVDWSYTKPAFFYPAFFLANFQIGELFESARNLGKFVLNQLS
jgi:undecaprenyl-diphosphatase